MQPEQDLAAIADPYDKFAQEIERCYMGKCGWNRRFDVKDTSIEAILPKAYELSRRHSIINLDYCRTSDTLYKTLLTYLYNASISPDHNLAKGYLTEAQRLFPKMPARNVSRSLALIQLRCIEKELFDSAQIVDTAFIERTIKESQKITAGFNYNAEDIADWYECIGDLFERSGLIDPCYANYQKAIWYALEIHDYEDRAIHLQRIREKTNAVFNTLPYNVKKAFLDNASANIDSLISETGDIGEFAKHTRLLDAYFKRESGMTLGYQIDTLSAMVLRESRSGTYLAIDIFSVMDRQQSIHYRNGDFDLCRKSLIVMINGLISGHVTRTNYATALQNLFSAYVSLGQYNNAGKVNEYLRKISHTDFEYYLPNNVMMLLSRHKEDSAIMMLNIALDSLPKYKNYLWHDRLQAECYALLRTIYNYQNDNYQVRKYDSILQSVEIDAPKVLSNVDKAQAVFEGARYDDQLYDQIGYYSEWANANYQLLQKSDSLLSLERDNADLVQKRFDDSLRSTNKIAQANAMEAVANKAAERRSYIIGGLGLLLLLSISLVVILSMRSRANTLKRESSEFEMESFKAAFLGHAIKRSIENVGHKIQIGLMDNDTKKYESAMGITHGVSLLFNEVSNDKTNRSNLYQEVYQIGKEYVNIASLTYNKIIEFKTDIDHHLAERIKLPRHLLVHLYVNAVEHGQLLDRPNSQIISSLKTITPNNCYIFTVEDNGIGISSNAKGLQKGQRKGGLTIIERGFKYYNRQQGEFRFVFNRHNDITPIYNKKGECSGTQATIKIFRHV